MTSGRLQDDSEPSEHQESLKQAFKKHPDSTHKALKKALRENLKSAQRAIKEQSDFVIPSEPKKLRLFFRDN